MSTGVCPLVDGPGSDGGVAAPAPAEAAPAAWPLLGPSSSGDLVRPEWRLRMLAC